MSSVASKNTEKFPEWYTKFRAALLQQAPRPLDISRTIAEGWTNSPKDLKKNLDRCLLRPIAPVSAEPAVSNLLLLEPVSTVIIPPTAGTFVAKERFVQCVGTKAKVEIKCSCSNFIMWFLKGRSKIEGPISKKTLLHCARLRKASLDPDIIDELGGPKKAETTLIEPFFLMQNQFNRDDGPMLKDGWWNVFYIRDQCGVLRRVRVRWEDGVWAVEARPVEASKIGRGGRHVFSRTSVLES